MLQIAPTAPDKFKRSKFLPGPIERNQEAIRHALDLRQNIRVRDFGFEIDQRDERPAIWGSASMSGAMSAIGPKQTKPDFGLGPLVR